MIKYKEDVRKNIGGGHQEQNRLVSPKDTNVQKLSERLSHADFTNWVEELYMHIEGTTGWSHSAPVPKMVRKEKTPITEDSTKKVLSTIHDDTSNDFDETDFETKVRSQELYKFLFPRLNNKLKGLVSNTKGGFEVLRRVVREHDPVTDNTKVAPRAMFTQRAMDRCANLDATRSLAQEIDRKLAEYREKTGEEMPAELQSTVLHGAMDDDMARDAVLAGVDMSNYTKIKKLRRGKVSRTTGAQDRRRHEERQGVGQLRRRGGGVARRRKQLERS